MASYETAKDLQTYVRDKVEKINDLIQDLPDISECEDVIEKISDINEYIDGLDSNTDSEVSKKLKTNMKNLVYNFNRIKHWDYYIRKDKINSSYKSIGPFRSSTTEGREDFLVRIFPYIGK